MIHWFFTSFSLFWLTCLGWKRAPSLPSIPVPPLPRWRGPLSPLSLWFLTVPVSLLTKAGWAGLFFSRERLPYLVNPRWLQPCALPVHPSYCCQCDRVEDKEEFVSLELNIPSCLPGAHWEECRLIQHALWILPRCVFSLSFCCHVFPLLIFPPNVPAIPNHNRWMKHAFS